MKNNVIFISKNDSNLYGYISQLCIYSALLSELKTPVQAEIVVFPKNKKKIVPKIHKFTFTVEEQAMTLLTEANILESIFDNNYYPNRSFGNTSCGYCSYKTICDNYLKGKYNGKKD